MSTSIPRPTSIGNTPDLVASSGPSPQLQRLRTPDAELPAFDLGAAALTVQEASKIPECWGHRGASASQPENTRASFIEACKQGADGIETDIHITSDNVLVMFHDPKLDRTTNGRGRIREQPWHGVLEHVRTKQSPVQPIPLFTEVLDILLMPGNERVKLNLDCKVDNDAEKLFDLVREVISRYPNWEERLAPRIVLGLWHPKFLAPAAKHLPYLPRYAISMSPAESRRYFWHSVHGFSIYYEALSSPDGQKFLAECKADGKGLCAWTVNTREGMRECVRWGVGSCITDKPDLWREVRAEFEADFQRAVKPTLQTYLLPYVNKKAWWFDIASKTKEERVYLEKEGGKFESWEGVEVGLQIVLPVLASKQDVVPIFNYQHQHQLQHIHLSVLLLLFLIDHPQPLRKLHIRTHPQTQPQPLSPPHSKSKTTGLLDLHYIPENKPVFVCLECSEVVALQDELVSKAFHGKSGQAYLLNSTINTNLGKREERRLLTGHHTVADLLCASCGTSLGWMYIRAPNGEQRYKEGDSA